jgi:hypothetical protein
MLWDLGGAAGMNFDDNKIDEDPYVKYADNEPVQVQDPDNVDKLGPETDAYNKYISDKVLLPSGDDMLYGTIL